MNKIPYIIVSTACRINNLTGSAHYEIISMPTKKATNNIYCIGLYIYCYSVHISMFQLSSNIFLSVCSAFFKGKGKWKRENQKSYFQDYLAAEILLYNETC